MLVTRVIFSQRQKIGAIGTVPGASQVALVAENLPAKAREESDMGSIPGVGNGNPLQCSCLENPTDRGAWWATVHWGAKS